MVGMVEIWSFASRLAEDGLDDWCRVGIVLLLRIVPGLDCVARTAHSANAESVRCMARESTQGEHSGSGQAGRWAERDWPFVTLEKRAIAPWLSGPWSVTRC